jgi:aldose 1-epimerase
VTAQEQVSIAGADFEAVVLPGTGARLHRLRVRGHELLHTPDRLDEHRREPFFWGAYPMAPWCNRVAPGPVEAAGRTVDLRPNFADGSAIHGQVYDAPWEQAGDGLFSIERGGAGWPWRYRVEQSFEAMQPGSGLRIVQRLTNLDDGPMPAGLGLHPWFAGRVAVVINAQRALASNEDPQAPLEPVRGDLDMRAERELHPGIDAAWTDLSDPAVVLHWPDLGLQLSLASADAAWVVAANPPDRDAIAVEPQTHAPQGLRRLIDGEPGGLTLLAPGESLRLTIELLFRS